MENTPQSETEPPRYVGMVSMCAMALVGAVVVALPSAYRTVRSGGSALDGFVMAMAVVLTLLLPLAWLKTKAARGFRAVVGPHVSRALGAGLGLWVSLGSLGLFALATVLKHRTHHRGLGGATFGVFGVGWMVLSAVMAARLVSFGRGLLKRGTSPSLIQGASALLVALPVGLMMAALVMTHNPGLVLGALFDLALLWLVVLALGWRPLPSSMQKVARYLALPLTVAVLLVGWFRVERSPTAGAVKQGGGLVGAVLSAMELWSDRDGDGRGAHFGGGDCDEGDPTRFPGAQEIAGDGIDSDCDGSDPPGALASVVIAPDPAAATAPVPAAPNGTGTVAAAASTTTTATSTATPALAAPPTASTLPARLLDKPDIILVTLDTVRADHTSVYGYAHKTTPNLEKLAKNAVVFEHCYAIGTSSQRALMPIASGLPLSDTPHSRREWPRIKEEADTVAERLQRAGYTTGAVSSFTWLRKDRGFNQGFDQFDESPFRDHHPERKSTGKAAI
ncbi:MAG TPA: cell wall anchor protein, partial [Sorangium sp.]|nr:cell wall anchor protein [Sorangium sp.]